MKILHINDNYRNLGGAERYLFDICKALEERGHQIVIISSIKNRHLKFPGRKEYFIQESAGIRSGLRTKDAIKKIVLEEEPHIVHLHNTSYFLSPMIVQMLNKLRPTIKFCHDTRLFCMNNGRKILPTGHLCHLSMGLNCYIQKCCTLSKKGCDGSDIRSNLIKIWEKRVAIKLDKIIVGSRYMYDELLRNSFSGERLFINPLYTEKSDTSQISSKPPSKEKIILWVGRFNHLIAIEQKGFYQLINSLKLLAQKNWRLVVAGDGEYITNVKLLVKDAGLEKMVDFVGSLSPEKLDTYYRGCTVVVMTPMHPESFGYSGIEAMAFGKPVVAFDAGGVREWLKHEETGFLVARGDIYELAGRINQLLENPSLALSLGRKGKEYVEVKFRAKNHIEALLDIYEEVIRQRVHH